MCNPNLITGTGEGDFEFGKASVKGYELSYVALSSSDPASAADILGEDLGMYGTTIKGGSGSDVFAFAAGRSMICVFDYDHPFLDRPGKTGVDHIALAVADPEGAAISHSMTLLGRGIERGIGDTRQVRVDPANTAGVRMRVNEP